MASGVPILMYHRIAPVQRRSTVRGHYVHPSQFSRQLRFLKLAGYRSVALGETIERHERRSVCITFDDGYVNFYTEALPRLEALGFDAVVFLVANLLGGSNAWDERLGDVHEPLMDVSAILNAQERGTEFGSHTLDHAALGEIDEAEAWRQIADSKALLEGVLGRTVNSFCYPYGSKSARVEAMVSKAGYRQACSTEKGMNYPDTNPYALRRINVRRDTSLPIFAAKLLRGRR